MEHLYVVRKEFKQGGTSLALLDKKVLFWRWQNNFIMGPHCGCSPLDDGVQDLVVVTQAERK